MKQKRVAVQLFLSFCIDIKGGKGQKKSMIYRGVKAKKAYIGAFFVFSGAKMNLNKKKYTKI
jgi:hypothetical protein